MSKPYYGVSGSFVFTELYKPDFLTSGKVRAGYSKVGQATDPFQTQLSYSIASNTLNGLPFGNPSNTNIPNRGLLPSEATELEVGTELGFLQSRIRVDLTLYKKNSKKEIVFTPASITSGYSGAVLNSGELGKQGRGAIADPGADTHQRLHLDFFLQRGLQPEHRDFALGRAGAVRVRHLALGGRLRWPAGG
ncbi:MAG: TonB-dependent receptor [Hymenobacter sp.]